MLSKNHTAYIYKYNHLVLVNKVKKKNKKIIANRKKIVNKTDLKEMPNSIDEDFFVKLNQMIVEANKNQTIEIKTEIESVKDSIKEEVLKRKELEQKYDILNDKYRKLEKSLRKNNVIVFGLENNTEENLINYIVKTLNTYLELNIDHRDINDVFTIGKQSDHKPVIIKFTSYLKKIELLRNCYKLKEVNKNRNHKITITEELSVDEIKTQKILRQHLNEAKSRKIHAYIRADKIYINGNSYTVEELELSEVKKKIEDTIDIRENSSTSLTQAVKNKKRETDEEDTGVLENCSKKLKLASTTGIVPRSSPRIQEKEEKIKKAGNQMKTCQPKTKTKLR